ncbi:MAG: hypothetical protein A2Z88_05920 [Omnitrophica WOR_2 bacterium GWA2_47_8]|nr:MAG: hypothetical protein A2Z88_05920 [Omnitrophica WOR_2 bacterium GWA2_47_8]
MAGRNPFNPSQNKTLKKTTLLLILFLLGISGTAKGQESFPFLGEIKGKNVNVRAGQNENFESVMRLQTGDKVVVVGKEFAWYKIKLPPGASAYVHSKYLKMLSKEVGEITGHRVNVRAGAGVNASSLGQLVRSTKVYVQAQKEDWLKVEPVEGLYGWVTDGMVDFISKDIPAPVIVEAPTRNIYKIAKELKKKAIEESTKETAKANEALSKIRSPISVAGLVKKIEESSSLEAKYKLIVTENISYTLQAPASILDYFVNYHTKVDGGLVFAVPGSSQSDTIQVRRIVLSY